MHRIIYVFRVSYWGFMNRKKKNESGQVAILFALVFTFMFILFGFVIDIGHLINNKINLQIAADNAAYAGAAWQARTLNQIATINYRMRQDLKELAMRINVTHSRHNRRYPYQSADVNGGDATANVELFVCLQANGYQSSSGVTYDNTTNICANASPTSGGIPPIIVPPVVATFDPFAYAIQSQIRAIQEASNLQCRAGAKENIKLVQHLINTYTQRSREHKRQITALVDWMNSVSQQNAMVEGSNPDHPLVKTAFQSAFKNLTLANKDGFRMDLIKPNGEYLAVRDIPLNMAIPYFEFSTAGDGCVAVPRFAEFQDMLGGVAKRRDVITYFSVKLTSKPKMFFMPERWLQDGEEFPILEAFAAAKPFGGRIGPQSGVDQLMPTPGRLNANPYPNFQFKADDRFGIQNRKMMAYFNILHPFNSASRTDGNRGTGWPEPAAQGRQRDPLTAIQAPTMFDAAFYTVFPNPDDATIQNDYLEPQYAKALYPDYMEAASGNSRIVLPAPRTPAYFPADVGKTNPGYIQIDATVSPSDSFFSNYNSETPGSHSVTSPSQVPDLDQSKLNQFGFATADQLHSGWSPEGSPGRIGYSVKMVGMDHLFRTLQVEEDNGQGDIANKPTGDPNIPFIYH